MTSPKRIYSVLLFEDNPGDVFLVEQAFAEGGYACRLMVAASHEEAQQFLAAQPFDLFLSDFGTNSLEAQDFLQSVRQQFATLPIVVFSGTTDQNAAYDAGASAFVRKESDLDKYSAKIQGIMRFWVDVAELPSTRRPA